MAEQKDQGILLKSGTNEVEFIEFYINGVSYGINVSKVQKVIELTNTQITRMLQTPPAVLGTFHLQDKPVGVIDLRQALNIHPDDIPEGAKAPEEQAGDQRAGGERKLILVTRFNRRTTGFVIDAVHKIHRTSWEHFQPISQSISDRGGDSGGYTTGTIEMNGRIVLVLDLERLMLDFCPEAHKCSEAAQAAMSSDEALRAKRAAARIIYAEDSTVIRKKTMQVMEKAGYTNITSFDNGQSAYEHIAGITKQAADEGKKVTDFVDCIVTDIEMPKMDGLTLCNNVKNGGNGGIPAVVVYSSLISDEMSAKCRSVGADAQLSKPHGEEIVVLLDKLCFGIEPTSNTEAAA